MIFDPDLAIILAFVIAFAVFLYVVMDGFDLGVALLFPFFPEKHDRDVMMNTVAPVWDGNETWLVLGGGAVFAAFPLAYAVLMPALYAPLIAMLLGLVFRGSRSSFAGGRCGVGSFGTSRSWGGRWWPPLVRGSRWGPCFRGSRSRVVPMPVAGGTG